MRIRFTKHAKFEMKRRSLDEATVIRAIRNPDQVIPSDKGREVRQRLLGKMGRMLLRVVVKYDGMVYHGVTASKTSNVAKYWRKP